MCRTRYSMTGTLAATSCSVLTEKPSINSGEVRNWCWRRTPQDFSYGWKLCI